MSSSAARDAAPPAPPVFRDRAEAGVRLGARLREFLGQRTGDHPERSRAVAPSVPVAANPVDAVNGGACPLVLALPRGGVPVAAGVARALGAPLDLLLVRKIGHPELPELGLGAIAEDGAGGAAEPYFDPRMLGRVGLGRSDLTRETERERAELLRRVALYARHRPAVSPAGRLVVVVDDGLATGVTARAALRAVWARGALRVVLAVPVAAPETAHALEKEAGEVVTLVTPRRLRSVGEWYVDFDQLTDADVLGMLARPA